jgi:hypothetical protein
MFIEIRTYHADLDELAKPDVYLPPMRWFRDIDDWDAMDLRIYLDKGEPYGLVLSYGDDEVGYAEGVFDFHTYGSERDGAGRYPATPVRYSGQSFPKDRFLAKFEKASMTLDPHLLEWVRAVLKSYKQATGSEPILPVDRISQQTVVDQGGKNIGQLALASDLKQEAEFTIRMRIVDRLIDRLRHSIPGLESNLIKAETFERWRTSDLIRFFDGPWTDDDLRLLKKIGMGPEWKAM